MQCFYGLKSFLDYLLLLLCHKIYLEIEIEIFNFL